MFALNGQRQSLCDVPPSTVLYDFLRTFTPYTGTKNGCGEGGCGACSVQVHDFDIKTGKISIKCINACLCPVGSLDGCSVVTIEGIGNAQIGYNAIQERIAGFHGSQCGFCTPGMVVACHTALSIALNKGEKCTLMQMEKAFDGNLCRCTGYRPILDGCKSLLDGVDLEDLGMHCMDKTMREHKDISLPKDMVFPSWLKDYCKDKDGELIKATGLKPGAASQKWVSPVNLTSLLQEVRRAKSKGKSVRLVGGNTGPGVFKDWPVDVDVLVGTTGVPELTSITSREEGLFIGAAVTQAGLIDYLLEVSSAAHKKQRHGSRIDSGYAEGPQGGVTGVYSGLAHHLQRIAGNPVRAAATMGGNLVLAKEQGLQSDIATLLAALQAQVGMISVDKDNLRWVSILELLDDEETALRSPDNTHILTSIHVPAIKPTNAFWSYKIGQRHFNAHAFVNVAIFLDLQETSSNGHKGLKVQDAHVVFGFDQQKGQEAEWQLQHAQHVEKALLSQQANMDTIGQAVAAVSRDVQPGYVPDASFLVAAAEGLLFEGLASLLRQGLTKESLLPQFVLEVDSIHDVPPSRGEQIIPNFRRPGGALGEPFMKERALLQASGEALYTLDHPVAKEGLWAAYVASEHSLAHIQAVDASKALQLPGVVAYMSAGDIPEAGVNSCLGQEPVFSDGLVEYLGQPIGLIVAEDRAAAERGAQLVKVKYSFPEDIGKPILQLSEARRVGCTHPLPPKVSHGSSVKEGGPSMQQALQECQHVVRGGSWSLPSQLHFYMEPQTVLAECDGEGGMEIWASSQSPQIIMQSTASVLGLPQNRCTARCRRMGGAFGGKTTRSAVPAAAVAVAANKLKKQVRMSVNRNQDLRMNAGRATIDLEYDIGFDDSGKIHALDLKLFLLGGVTPGGSMVDVGALASLIDQAYAIPSFQFDIKLYRSNRPPHSAVRAPGKFQAPLIMEHIIEHVAARLNMDPVIVRETNFIKAPAPGAVGEVTTALGIAVSASLYTLPRLWDQLKQDAQFDERLAQVKAFNRDSVWLKRGISMTPCRFRSVLAGGTGPRPCLVNLYPDGTVLVTCAGTEMGQGLFTKAKQVALHELSKALPESLRPLPAHLVEVADNNTSALPNTGIDADSTTAEGACESVRLACQQLVQNTLAPMMQDVAEAQKQHTAEAKWKAVLQQASSPTIFPSPQLSAYAIFDGSRRDKPPGEEKLMYSGFGAGCSEVEVNMLTGERRVLRADIIIDAGNSLSPAIDAGQAEGGFVYAMGMLMQEGVTYNAKGQPEFDTTWNYKIPSAACIPREIIIHMLQDSPNKVGIMSSKSTGEPPLLTSVSVLTAFQAAITAAKQDLTDLQTAKGSGHVNGVANRNTESVREQVLKQLQAPVTVKEVKRVIGDLHLSQLLLSHEP